MMSKSQTVCVPLQGSLPFGTRHLQLLPRGIPTITIAPAPLPEPQSLLRATAILRCSISILIVFLRELVLMGFRLGIIFHWREEMHGCSGRGGP